MHSLIFELVKEQSFKNKSFCEIETEDLSDYHKLIGADYISKLDKTTDSIEWLQEYIKAFPYIQFGKDNCGYYIVIDEKAERQHATNMIRELHNKIETSIKAMNKENFNGSLEIYRLKSYITGFGSFCFICDGDFYSIQQLLLYLTGKLYINNVFDYHY